MYYSKKYWESANHYDQLRAMPYPPRDDWGRPLPELGTLYQRESSSSPLFVCMYSLLNGGTSISWTMLRSSSFFSSMSASTSLRLPGDKQMPDLYLRETEPPRFWYGDKVHLTKPLYGMTKRAAQSHYYVRNITCSMNAEKIPSYTYVLGIVPGQVQETGKIDGIKEDWLLPSELPRRESYRLQLLSVKLSPVPTDKADASPPSERSLLC